MSVSILMMFNAGVCINLESQSKLYFCYNFCITCKTVDRPVMSANGIHRGVSSLMLLDVLWYTVGLDQLSSATSRSVEFLDE